MEADGFVRRGRVSAENPGGDAAVAGASAGAEIRWLGGRIWGVSEGIVGSLSPRIQGESEVTTVQLYSPQEVSDLPEPDYEGLPQGVSTSTYMLAGAVAGIMEHCLMFPIDCVKVTSLIHLKLTQVVPMDYAAVNPSTPYFGLLIQHACMQTKL